MIYIAFLRGINVGGNKKVPMKDLKKAMEKGGFSHVFTLLNSGNVVFESDGTSDEVRKKLEQIIEKKFGFQVPVLIRTGEYIDSLVESDPFGDVKVDVDTRLYVTFIPESKRVDLKLPYISPNKEYKILSLQDGALFSVLQLTGTLRTTDAMEILEKLWGKGITTRNWNTILKIAAL